MSWSNTTSKDIQGIVKKLSLEQKKKKGRSPHPVYYYHIRGEKIRVTVPNQHGGSGSLSKGFINSIRKSLRINTGQFVDLRDCPLSAEEYERLLAKKLGLDED